MKKKEFKTHMMRSVSHDEFRTYCGITEDCSESIREFEAFVREHNEVRTTCKKCLRSYKKGLRLEEKTVRQKMNSD